MLILIFALLFVAGAGAYVATLNGQVKTTTVLQTTTSQPRPGMYQLQLLEPMNTGWNATLAQPKFFVVGPNGLQSSANITVPVNTLIQLTIVSYDTPTPGSTDSMGVVNGTMGGNVYLINGTTAMSSATPEQWGKNVTSVPGAALAHTFTIQQLGVNIPVVGGDTEIAYLFFTRTGTFTWLCLTPCGFGPTGLQGAMSATGWMTGNITVK